MISTLILHYLVTGIGLTHALSQRPSELRIQTSSGTVHGIYNDTATTVRGFLGVPYAEPPMNKLRFAPPRGKSPSSSPIDASSFSSPCPQTRSWSNNSILDVLPYTLWNSAAISEDCLYLNVWAPATKHRKADSKAAVMVFIHGGDFAFGGTSIAYYDGTNIVRDNTDIIVVSINYRLNVFGFPNAPGLEPSRRNLGLQDQRLAIEWVYDNIAQFGGDPERIILFGQSVGAASADMYSYAYPNNPLIKGVIMQSGTYNTGPIARSENNWNRLSNSVHCGSGMDSMSCMMRMPMSKIVDAMANGVYTFLPTNDGLTFFTDFPARAKEGKIADLPTLAGFNDKELAFVYPLYASSINESEVREDSQVSFNCPLVEDLQLRLDNNIPTWRYLYQGSFPNLSPKPWLGAYHTSEIPLVFGTYNVSTPYSQSASKAEIETSRYMQEAWVAFAKDPDHGLSKYGWPRFSFQSDSLVNLGVGSQSPAKFTSSFSWDRHCNHSDSIDGTKNTGLTPDANGRILSKVGNDGI